MTIEQVERHDVDQLWLPLEGGEHIGREAGRRVPLTCDPLAHVAFGVDELGAIGQEPQGVIDRRS
jgi:hypothetical protein